MTSLGQVLRLLITELKIFFREPQAMIFVFGFPVLTVLVLSGVFGTATDNSGFEFVNPSDHGMVVERRTRRRLAGANAPWARPRNPRIPQLRRRPRHSDAPMRGPPREQV